MNGDFLAYTRDHAQDPAETVQKNLGELHARQMALHRARAFWLGELIADQDADTLPASDEIRDIWELLSLQDGEQSCYDKAMQQADQIALGTEISARFPAGYALAFADLFGAHSTLSADAQGRVAYVANSYTEQAFMELTGFIKNRRVAYFHGFEDVCQEVRSGLCEYGILPIESTLEGSMSGLLRLIELYDLRICALCYVPTPQSGGTAFALIRQTLPVQLPTAQHCMDLLFSPASPADTGRLIGAAALCSHALLHAATYTGEDNELFRLRFSVSPDTFYPFLLYLLLFCADVTPIGFYTENKK